MVDHEAIENYVPPAANVESIHGDRIRIYFGDQLPEIGTAVAIELDDDTQLFAVVERQAGTGRVDAWLPMCPSRLIPGLAAKSTGQPAALAVPQDQPITPSPEMIGPLAEETIPLYPRPPRLAELIASRPALDLGLNALDALAPICRGGVNLVIDTTTDGLASRRLATRAACTLTPRTALLCTPEDRQFIEDPSADQTWRICPDSSLPSQIASLQYVISCAPLLRQSSPSMAIVELPRLQTAGNLTSADRQLAEPTAPTEGLPEVVDRITRHLVSTAESSLTTLLLLHIPTEIHDLAQIIETLRLGEVDATTFIDEQGRFDPRRSTSGAELDESARRRRREYLRILDTAHRAREKASLLGDVELTDGERAAVNRANELRPKF